MKKYYPVLLQVSLFHGMTESDFEKMLSCLSVKISRYQKNETVFFAGEELTSVGIVLSGNIQITNEDIWGNRNLLAEFGEGELFAESFAFAKTKIAPVTAISTTESEIMFVDHSRILAPCCSACKFHLKMIENMLSVLSGKNILLNEKNRILSKRSTRDKLLAYLCSQSQKRGSNLFSVPFDRQELADYLCVDRSAMSSELGKLREEGVLRFHKNDFELLGNLET